MSTWFESKLSGKGHLVGGKLHREEALEARCTGEPGQEGNYLGRHISQCLRIGYSENFFDLDGFLYHFFS